MAQTNAQRQASYRAKRKAAGDCIEPGCGNPAAPYTRCETHRLKAKQAAAEGRITKTEHQAVLAERDDLQKRYRELHWKFLELEVNLEVRQRMFGDPWTDDEEG